MRTGIQMRRRRRWIALALATASLATASAADARPDSGEPGVTPPAPPAQEVELVTPDSFDWADAGIGAGAAAGILVLAGAAAGAGLRRRLTGSRQRAEGVLS
jgi:hypothetical protein